MSCIPCGQATFTAPTITITNPDSVDVSNAVITMDEPITDNIYPVSVLNNWRIKLKCVKENALFETLNITPPELNKYLGIVISGINTPGSFVQELNKIQDVIMSIVNSGKC